MSNRKYKIGDKVWIKKDLISDKDGLYGRTYTINESLGETDIRGQQVTITDFDGNNAYICKEYNFFTDLMIDKEKTNSTKEIIYEIY